MLNSRFSKAANVVIYNALSQRINGIYSPIGPEHSSDDWPVYQNKDDPELYLVYAYPQWMVQTATDRAIDEQSRLAIVEFEERPPPPRRRGSFIDEKPPKRVSRAFTKLITVPPTFPDHRLDGQEGVTEYTKFMGGFFKTSGPTHIEIKSEAEMEGSEQLEDIRRKIAERKEIEGQREKKIELQENSEQKQRRASA